MIILLKIIATISNIVLSISIFGCDSENNRETGVVIMLLAILFFLNIFLIWI